MAKILLCLEEAEIDGPKLSADCQSKVMDAKERIMGDYELSHALVEQCHNDVNRFCQKEADSNEEGAVIDCLMGKVADDSEDDHGQQRQPTETISVGCTEELEKLVERADPGSDYHIDHALEKACRSFIDGTCKPDSGEGDSLVLSCLMEKVDNKDMDDTCRKHLIHLQYFVARDFKLDHQLFSACKESALQVCKTSFAPSDQNAMDENLPKLPHQMVLACLYRAEIADDDDVDNTDDDADHKISPVCHTEVLRALRERAVSVNLNPALHEACLRDLGSHCSPSGDDGDSQEFKCLQQNYEIVTMECKKALKEWTAVEAEDIRLNKPLMRACKQFIVRHCQLAMTEGEGVLVQCLVEHKNDEDVPRDCVKEIETFQKV
jgi:Golgi apparatus protein 1